MTDLDQLLHSDKPWVQQRAQMALQIVNQRQLGQISGDEARELLEDLVRTDVLEQEADDLEMKTFLVSSIYALVQIMG
jgi:hypothetical protein